MSIESVKVLKTLVAGDNMWPKGAVFPNRNCPQIPPIILAEAELGRGTVEILSEMPDEVILSSKPKYVDEGETNTTVNVASSIKNKHLDPVEEPEEVEAPKVETKSTKATRPKSKKKTSLAKRK